MFHITAIPVLIHDTMRLLWQNSVQWRSLNEVERKSSIHGVQIIIPLLISVCVENVNGQSIRLCQLRRPELYYHTPALLILYLH